MYNKEEILYHKDIGFPDLPMRPVLVTLKYSNHALERAETSKYGRIKLPKQVVLKRENLIELGMIDGKVTKIVTRQPYSSEYDLILVVCTGNNFVKTCWLNAVNDNHPTLDKTRYAVP